MEKQRHYKFHNGKIGAAISIHVTPRARKNEVVGISADGVIRIHLTSPPLDGKANKALIDFLAGYFDVKKSDIEIVAGHSGREKIVAIINKSSVDIQKILSQQIEK